MVIENYEKLIDICEKIIESDVNELSGLVEKLKYALIQHRKDLFDVQGLTESMNEIHSIMEDEYQKIKGVDFARFPMDVSDAVKNGVLRIFKIYNIINQIKGVQK